MYIRTDDRYIGIQRPGQRRIPRGGRSALSKPRSPAEEIVAPAGETPPRVVKLMEALKKSLDAVSATKKKPAKAAVAQPAAKRKRA
jgi:hypothetical protein